MAAEDETHIGEANKRLTGTVKWFNGWKGFGFITPEIKNEDEQQPSDDLFVHQTSIKFDGFRTLYDGQKVEFEVDVAEDGRSRAIDVVPLGRRRRSGVVECYNCGRIGHFARDCYAAGRGDGGGGGGTRGGGGGRFGRGRRGGGGGGGGRRGGGRGGGDGGGGRVDCFNCGEEGHFARNCHN